MSALFSPLRMRDVTLRNRIVVSPMCEYSSSDGFADDWHVVHLGSRAVGGAALVLTEAIAVTPEGRISPADLGIWKDEHVDQLARIARFCNAQGAAWGTQLAHAGRKASTKQPWFGTGAVAEAARESYRAGYPQYVKKTRLVEPSAIDNMRSLGNAKKFYHAAEEAWRAAEHAAGEIRRIEHNEAQLEIELAKALERAPHTSKDVTTSETWLNEVHSEEDMAEAKAKHDAVTAERDDYAKRLGAGTVSAQELRLRAFALEDVKHITPAFDALMFLRIDQFGDRAYFIMRDLRRRLFALPYDRRLEPLLDGAYDIVKNGKEFDVRRAKRDNTPIGLTLLEHFTKCSESAEAAQAAYRDHQEFVKAKRSIPTASEPDEVEAAVIELLAAVAAEKAR
jgi:hypothetical protein